MPIRARNMEKGAVSNQCLGGPSVASTFSEFPSSGHDPVSCKRGYTYEDFKSEPVYSKVGVGGAPTGTAGDRDLMRTQFNTFEYQIKGTQTILVPTLTAEGLNIVLDNATAADGLEITHAGSSILARGYHVYTIGTSAAFFFRVKAKIEDVSGVNPFGIMFRKVEAYQATIAAYADYAFLGIIGTASPNTIFTTTEKAGGGATSTDTLNTWADLATKTLQINVSSAGAVTYLIDGVAPTASVAMSFTAADVVVPSLFYLVAADLPGEIELIEWECGFQDPNNG
jgi:hypothetical protein